MGFNLNKEEGEGRLDDSLEDLNSQVEFHKDKLINSDIEQVEDVLSRVITGILNGLDAECALAVTPMLSAIAESIIELKATNVLLTAELIEKKMPPPDNFEIN